LLGSTPSFTKGKLSQPDVKERLRMGGGVYKGLENNIYVIAGIILKIRIEVSLSFNN